MSLFSFSSSKRFAWLFAALVGVGCLLHVILVFKQGINSGGLAGCGGGGCEEVMMSRWSTLLGLPVSVYALGLDLGLWLSLTSKRLLWREALVGIAAGGALWLVVVQVGWIHRLCPWCLASHAVMMGLLAVSLLRSAAIRGWLKSLRSHLGWVLLGAVCLALAQELGPRAAGYRLENLNGGSSQGGGTAQRRIEFDGGRLSYEVESMPCLGNPDAERVLVEFFDYQCPACRIMAGHLEELVAKFPNKVAVVCLPMPLDRSCNPDVPPDGNHPGSCQISRMVLAVALAKPDAFPEMNRMLWDEPTVEAAERYARRVLPEEEWERAMKDPRIGLLLQKSIMDWKSISRTTSKLPKLLIRDRRVLHGLPSGREDFIRVMQQELQLGE